MRVFEALHFEVQLLLADESPSQELDEPGLGAIVLLTPVLLHFILLNEVLEPVALLDVFGHHQIENCILGDVHVLDERLNRVVLEQGV